MITFWYTLDHYIIVLNTDKLLQSLLTLVIIEYAQHTVLKHTII